MNIMKKRYIFIASIIIMWIADAIMSYTLFWIGLAICSLTVIIFFASAVLPEPTTHEVRTTIPSKSIEVHNDNIPYEFADIQDIDKHTKQVTWKGKSFVVTGYPDGRKIAQEVNVNTNQPIGNKFYSDSDQELGKVLKDKFKKI